MNFLGQLWKMNGNTLTNKGNVWKSNAKWKMAFVRKFKDIEFFAILNLLDTNKVLGILQNGDVTEQTIEKDTPGPAALRQLWGKIPFDPTTNQDYFKLTNFKRLDQLLTATSDLGLEMRGKYVYWIWTIKIFD